jgi:hypothetical protein
MNTLNTHVKHTPNIQNTPRINKCMNENELQWNRWMSEWKKWMNENKQIKKKTKPQNPPMKKNNHE